ncbi:thioesterase superfamily protein [Alicyclobacillus hesperidum URH17-3-68]|nr:thioesterase superfamily protein [Alicyclobacillus hesperidum URH17-3-68]
MIDTWAIVEVSRLGFDYCFVCGENNPHGLHIHFEKDGDGVVGYFHTEPHHMGWPNVQHGGITSSLLDEASAYVPLHLGLVTVTAELNIAFKKPIRVGERVRIEAHPTKISSRLLLVDAKITGEDGEEKASSKAKMIVLTKAQKEELGIGELS